LADEARFDTAWTGRLQVYSDGVLVIPSDVTISVYNTSDDTIIDPDNDIEADGTITFELTKAQLGIAGATGFDWYVSADIEVGSTYTLFATARFFVVRTPLICSVTDADLDAVHPGILLDRASSVTTWTKQIAQAFDDVKADIRMKGYDPNRMIDGAQVKRAVVARTLYLIYNAYGMEPNDHWFTRAVMAAEQYQHLIETGRFYYDVADDSKTTGTKVFGRTLRFIR